MKLMAMVATMSLAGSGCAMTFQERPPRSRVAVTHCAESSPLPIIDTVVGVTGMVAAGSGLYYAWGRDHEGYVLPAGLVAVASMIALGSARSGFGWVSECRDRSGIVSR